MEHPCSKCGALVTDGLPFCPHCKNPQIRVSIAEPVELIDEVHNPQGEGGVARERGVSSVRLDPHKLDWHTALPPAAVGGLVSFLTQSLAGLSPVFGLLGLVVGGITAVLLYWLRSPKAPTTTLTGAKIGAAAGGFTFAIAAIRVVAAFVYQPDEMRNQFADQMTRTASQLTSLGFDPAQSQASLDTLKTDEGLRLYVAILLATLLIVQLIGSIIGGAICASWLRRR